MTVSLEQATELARAYTAAWNTGKPDVVAGFFTPEGQIIINDGEPWLGRAGVAQMASGFFADVPDLALSCDGVRVAGNHVIYLWTFTGMHATSKRKLRVTGWEEWDLDASLKVVISCGWFDADDYARQTGVV
jgi:uncharacterized protein (TIGR02246 family)